MDSFMHAWFDLQSWLFEGLVQPLLFALQMGNRLEDAYIATGWVMMGLLQLLLMVVVIAPLQLLRPVEPVTDRATIRTDVVYTLFHTLGGFRLLMFFMAQPLLDEAFAGLRNAGVPSWQLDQIWVGVSDLPWVSVILYLVILDACDYAIHRAQHHWNWWWQLHALHHAQRQMTLWSDHRNHLLDDVLRDVLLLTVAYFVGVAPAQFVWVVFVTQISQSLQHANLRLSWGAWGERLWVSPRFHRRHHAIGIGHESVHPLTHQTTRGGCNYGVLLPWWDICLGTADFRAGYPATGIRDQVENGRDYGQTLWQQQKLGLLRLWGKGG
jgi:sterol desaturase/sphingolipid hydroxylase (fatty acid hydroxylase superfamily)